MKIKVMIMMMVMMVMVMVMMIMMMMMMTIVSVEQRPGWGEHVSLICSCFVFLMLFYVSNIRGPCWTFFSRTYPFKLVIIPILSSTTKQIQNPKKDLGAFFRLSTAAALPVFFSWELIFSAFQLGSVA